MTVRNILINALGVVDSGGFVVLSRTLKECASYRDKIFYVICNDNRNIRALKKRHESIKFITIRSGRIYRVFYENFLFRILVKKFNINLIYNYSGSGPLSFLINTPQIIKIHNLHYFYKKFDSIYFSKSLYFEWFTQVFLRRAFFKFMLNQSRHVEIQSIHVQRYLYDFIDVSDKFFYEKSDISISRNEFCKPKHYDFSKKLRFLYIVGPHFYSLHKNLLDFKIAMIKINEMNIDFDITITLTREQLSNSGLWDESLNSKTNFIGYVNDRKKLKELFRDNTILISTSIIETLGLHVIEGIKNGVITISPNETYANTVYGKEMIKYKLFDSESLVNTIIDIMKYNGSFDSKILSVQKYLIKSEKNKLGNILDLFEEVSSV